MAKDIFGKNLERLLLSRGMTISTLAKKTGVSKSTLQGYVGASGNFPSNPMVLKAIAEVFEISVHQLIFGEPDPFSVSKNISDEISLEGHFKIQLQRISNREKK